MAKYLLRFFGFFLVYFLVAKLGLTFNAVAGFASPVWLPSGLAFGFVLIFGYKYLPSVLLGAAFTNYLAGASFPVASGIGLGNMAEALVGVYLFRSVVRFKDSFESMREVLLFIFVIAPIAGITGATIGNLALSAGNVVHSAILLSSWFTWTMGDFLGIVIAAPFIIEWSKKVQIPKGRTTELFFLLFTQFFINVVIFDNFVSIRTFIKAYMIFPFVIWSALRFGKKGATFSAFVFALAGVFSIINKTNPFVGPDQLQNLFNLQIFIAFVSGTCLAFAVTAEERLKAESQIEELNKELRSGLNEKTIALEKAQKISHTGSWKWDLATNSVEWSDEMYRIYGQPREFKVTFDKAMEQVPLQEREKIKKDLENIIKNAKPGVEQISDFEYHILLPKGGNKFLHSLSQVVVDDKGKVVSMEGTVQDITEQKKIMDELERMNNLMVGREIKMAEMKKELKKKK